MLDIGAVTILECERKWLLRQPQQPRRLDAASVSVASMEQWYLPKLDGARLRIRQTATAQGVTYSLTEKRRLDARVAEEMSLAISAEEYRALMRLADPRRAAVRKTRWTLPSAGPDVVEVAVDHLISPAEAWIAEVEYTSIDSLESAGPGAEPPPWLGPRAEVTELDGWRCAAIARRGLPDVPEPA